MYEIETCWNEMCLQAIFMAKYVLFVRVCSNVGYHVAKYREIVWWHEEGIDGGGRSRMSVNNSHIIPLNREA